MQKQTSPSETFRDNQEDSWEWQEGIRRKKYPQVNELVIPFRVTSDELGKEVMDVKVS